MHHVRNPGGSEAAFKFEETAERSGSLPDDVKERDCLLIQAWSIKPSHYHFADEARGHRSGKYVPDTFHAASGQTWRMPAAWRAKVVRGQVAEWQVYADNRPVYEILSRSA
jgi:hypothetical protein